MSLATNDQKYVLGITVDHAYLAFYSTTNFNHNWVQGTVCQFIIWNKRQNVMQKHVPDGRTPADILSFRVNNPFQLICVVYAIFISGSPKHRLWFHGLLFNYYAIHSRFATLYKSNYIIPRTVIPTCIAYNDDDASGLLNYILADSWLHASKTMDQDLEYSPISGQPYDSDLLIRCLFTIAIT